MFAERATHNPTGLLRALEVGTLLRWHYITRPGAQLLMMACCGGLKVTYAQPDDGGLIIGEQFTYLI